MKFHQTINLFGRVIETANILHHATERSLLILDEIGRGTSTYDGVSIAWAVIEYIHNHPHLRARTFFATHYHELTQLAELLPGVRNYNVAVSEADGNCIFFTESSLVVLFVLMVFMWSIGRDYHTR
jgi:DNA mismatch repair ATPase MutS